jgi:hypothetical protein
MMDLAAVFMRFRAFTSFGFVKLWAFENLLFNTIPLGGGRELPVESSSIETHDNPCVWEQRVVFFKEFDVFVARLCHIHRRV